MRLVYRGGDLSMEWVTRRWRGRLVYGWGGLSTEEVTRLQRARLVYGKALKKPHKGNLPFGMPCLEKSEQHRPGSIQRSLDFQSVTLPINIFAIFLKLRNLPDQ